MEAGGATVNRLPAHPDQRVFRGQEVSVKLFEPPDKLLAPEPLPLSIVYEDPWLIVVDKPAGVVAHPVGGYQSHTLSNAIQHHLDRQTHAKGLLRPGIVHRLDRMTSGLIVVTKDHLAHRKLSADFQNSRPEKHYIALSMNRADFDERVIDVPIGIHPSGDSVLMSTAADARRPRRARTDVVVLRRFRNATLFRCRLHTGRNHQIRVHLSHIGHPIVGDEFYGNTSRAREQFPLLTNVIEEDRHALHASDLSFDHPIVNSKLTFTSKLPLDLETLCRNIERTSN